MSNRDLFLGVVVILIVGAVAWLLVQPDDTLLTVNDEAQVASNVPAGNLPDDLVMEDDRAILEAEPDPMNRIALGDVAPDFELESLQNGSFVLDEQRGNVVVLNFWATWCEPCRDEMPDLVMAQDSLTGAGVVFAGVSIDEEGREIVAPFHETFPVDYPLLLDGFEVAQEYGAHYVVPTTIVIGRDGYIVDRLEGAVTLEEFLPRLREHARK